MKTLADAKLASPWPVALSIHPRYMAAPLGDMDFATALERLGLDEVVLMIYVVSRERVLQIVTAILDAHTGLRFGVAQSVEPFLAPREDTCRDRVWGVDPAAVRDAQRMFLRRCS